MLVRADQIMKGDKLFIEAEQGHPGAWMEVKYIVWDRHVWIAGGNLIPLDDEPAAFSEVPLEDDLEYEVAR